MFKRFLHKLSGREWKAPKAGKRWQDNPQFVAYFDELIAPGSGDYQAGSRNSIKDALRNVTGGVPLSRGISVGAGVGSKERDLIKAGLVSHFDLYEVSADRVQKAKQEAAREGLAKSIDAHLADAFGESFNAEYDLVYWDSALHHMFDVDQALKWSIKALIPGGVLLVSEYIGPTRLQWRQSEVSRVRRFLRDNSDIVGVSPGRVRRGTLFRRFKQFLRDPSEAPQSDKILDLYRKHTGQEMKILGGSAIHLAGGFMTGLEHKDPTLHDRLIALDQQMLEEGLFHFGFGIWQKPA